MSTKEEKEKKLEDLFARNGFKYSIGSLCDKCKDLKNSSFRGVYVSYAPFQEMKSLCKEVCNESSSSSSIGSLTVTHRGKPGIELGGGIAIDTDGNIGISLIQRDE